MNDTINNITHIIKKPVGRPKKEITDNNVVRVNNNVKLGRPFKHKSDDERYISKRDSAKKSYEQHQANIQKIWGVHPKFLAAKIYDLEQQVNPQLSYDELKKRVDAITKLIKKGEVYSIHEARKYGIIV